MLALAFGVTPAAAQKQTVAEVAAYQGPDRIQRLIAGAKAEGALVLYTSRVADDTNPVVDAFAKNYGIDVQVWRASNRQVLQRVVQERRAGRCAVDVSRPARRRSSRCIASSCWRRCARPPRRSCCRRPCGRTANGSASASTSSRPPTTPIWCKPRTCPKSYDDLKNPKWKGRLAIEAEDVDWFAAIATSSATTRLVAVSRHRAHERRVRPQRAHAARQHGRGGRGPVRADGLQLQGRAVEHAGAPIRALYLPPVVALATGVAVARCATHPNAAVLFYDFMLRDAQAILAKHDIVPTNLRSSRCRPASKSP